MEKGFKILSVMLFVATLFDFYTTIINKDLIIYLEANPIYEYVGLTGILLVNVIIYFFYYWAYHRSKCSISFRYITIVALILLIYLKITVGISNLEINKSYNMNPDIVLEAAKQVTKVEKVNFMINFVNSNLIAPILSMISFLFFKIDHNITKKNE